VHSRYNMPHSLAGEYFLALILIYSIHTYAPITHTHTHGVRKNNGTLHHRSTDTIESERIEFQRTREVRAVIPLDAFNRFARAGAVYLYNNNNIINVREYVIFFIVIICIYISTVRILTATGA